MALSWADWAATCVVGTITDRARQATNNDVRIVFPPRSNSERSGADFKDQLERAQSWRSRSISDLKTPGPWTLFRLTVVPKGSLFPVLPVFRAPHAEDEKTAEALRPLAGDRTAVGAARTASDGWQMSAE